MSKPKKPGTDLAALKARLAKKTKAAEPAPPPADVPPPGQVAAPPPEPPPAEVPAPGQVMPPADVPAPGEVAAPAPVEPQHTAPADVPAPGEVAPPPMADVPPPGVAPDVPPPGVVAQPPMAAPDPGFGAPGQPGPSTAPGGPPAAAPAPVAHAPAPAPAPIDDGDPFGGGPAAAFDPDAGVIDGGGEVVARGSKGLVVFVALLAAVVGGIGGFLANKILTTGEYVDAGKRKGAVMLEEVNKVAEMRARIAANWDDTKKAIATDPSAGAGKVAELITTNFDQHPQLDNLFGWQLAAVHPTGVKRTFELYEHAQRLKYDLGVLGKFLETHAGALTQAGGPTLFAVAFKSNGAAVLVEALRPMCGPPPPKEGEGAPAAEGEAPAAPKLDPATLKECEDPSKAVAFEIRDSVGADAKKTVVLRGFGKGQAQLLIPEGPIFNYAMGLEPNKNALNVLNSLFKNVKTSLDEMGKKEKTAITAMENFLGAPTVDDSSSQPDPAGGEG